jgi:hypothetical protein
VANDLGSGHDRCSANIPSRDGTRREQLILILGLTKPVLAADPADLAAVSKCKKACHHRLLMVPVERIELPTFGLQNRCSTAELNRHLMEFFDRLSLSIGERFGNLDPQKPDQSALFGDRSSRWLSGRTIGA